MSFRSAEEAIAAMFDPTTGRPAEHLIDLLRLHGGRYDPNEGLLGLRKETQRLWVPKDADERPTKVVDLNVNKLDSEYPARVKSRSWDYLMRLGCLDRFFPTFRRYTHVLAHGTRAFHAQSNFYLMGNPAIRNALMTDAQMFMLSCPAAFDLDFTPRFGPDDGQPMPMSEIGWMGWLWKRTINQDDRLARLNVRLISTCDAREPRGDPIIPDTSASLNAMWQCCFDPSSWTDEHDAYQTEAFPASGAAILNLSATLRQLLRQHVATRAFFRRKGITCKIETVNALSTEDSLFLCLRELAMLFWELHAEQVEFGSSAGA